jgi:hypothetical protein
VVTLRKTREKEKDVLRVDDVRVLQADLRVGVGVVHLVEHALLPASVRCYPTYQAGFELPWCPQDTVLPHSAPSLETWPHPCRPILPRIVSRTATES